MKLEMKKINLCIAPPSERSLKRRHDFREVSSKRLKYCFKKSSASICDPVNVSLKFNDTEYFYMINDMKSVERKQSNLLQREKKSLVIQKPEDQNCSAMKANRCPSKKEMNGSIFDGYQTVDNSRSLCSSHQKRKIKSRPASCLTNRNQADKQKQINPYTQEEYLYFRKKDKEKMKQTIQQIKNRQMQYNILKPCQIFQKQIRQREHSFFQENKQISMIVLQKKPTRRSLTSRPKKQEMKLDPWQSNMSNAFQDDGL